MSAITVRVAAVTTRPRPARRRVVLRPRATWLAAGLFVGALLAGLLTGYLLSPPV